MMSTVQQLNCDRDPELCTVHGTFLHFSSLFGFASITWHRSIWADIRQAVHSSLQVAGSYKLCLYVLAI